MRRRHQYFFLVALLLSACDSKNKSDSDASDTAAATSTPTDRIAGVFTSNRELGALLLNDEGQTLAPIASFDSAGKLTEYSGVVYHELKGGNVTVAFDETTHLPSYLVQGKYIYLFSSWDLTNNTVNMTEIYPDNQWIKSYQKVDISRALALSGNGLKLTREDKLGSGSCVFDHSCPSTEKKLAELFRIGSLAVSVTACVAYAGGTAGLGLFACSSALIAEAKFLIGNEVWLNKVEKLGKVLLAANVYRCTAGIDVGACFEVLIDLENHVLQHDGETLSTNESLITRAWVMPLGTSQGTEPTRCPSLAQCSPGAFISCIDGGSKQCRSDCTWGACPSDTTSTSPTGTTGTTGTTGPTPSTNSPFQGSYTATYSGTCVGRTLSGGVAVVVAKNGAITVDGGSGSGSVNDSGGATFGGGDGYTFSGTFTATNGVVKAAGTWSSGIAKCTNTRWSI